MSTIILHDKKNNNWNSLGIGPLQDAINPLSTRERNGIYDMTFQYPVVGKLFHELKVGRWIVADAGPTLVAKSQRFEIAQITKPIKGIVTVYCEHYRYKLLRTMVKIGSKYSNISAQTALNQLRSQMEPKSDFTFYSDVGTTSSIDFTDPAKYKNAQEVLGGVAGSILDNFGGEYLFNNNQVRLLAKAGTETNVVIAYGKNLTDINQEESIENTYTSVYGWAKIGNGDDEKIITLPEVYIDSDYVGNYTERRIQMVDFSDKEPKDVEALRGMVKSFIKSNNVGIPRVSIKASYVDLASSVSNEQLKNLEIVDLCDWVTVAFNQLNINTTAQIVKTVWNISLDRYESIELGEARTDFAKVIEDSKTDTEDIKDKLGWLEQAQKEASDIIKNPGKGHVVIYPSIADPQELLIMDTTDVNTARKVWRWNVGGLGFSSTGYNGTYGLAMTNNGLIVADRMATGTLKAIDIIGVTITGSTISTESSKGKLMMKDGSLSAYGSNGTLYGKIEPYLKDGNSGMQIDGDGNGVWIFGNAKQSSSPGVIVNQDSIRLGTPNLAVSMIGGLFTVSGGDIRLFPGKGSEVLVNGDFRQITGKSRLMDVIVSGNLSVGGTKNAIHETSYGIRATPAYELAESYLGDIGRSNTSEGKSVWIPIEKIFKEIINSKTSYEVFLQPYGNGKVWVSEFQEDGFTVCSDVENLEFAWEIKAKRKNYEQDRLEIIEI